MKLLRAFFCDISFILSVIIQAGFFCLFMLVYPPDLIDFSVLQESGSGLVVVEGDAVFHTLAVYVQHPVVITDPGFRTGFTADADFFDGQVTPVKERPEINRPEQRLKRD